MINDLFDDSNNGHLEQKSIATGTLRKMYSEHQQPIQYQLRLSEQTVDLNPLLGQKVTLFHTGKIHCLHCNELTNKSFGQGYCYKHFMALAQNDSCMMSPEKCHFDQGTCREPQFGESVCKTPHYVYLANASGVKVGITRGTQIPTRWIDQGATQAIPIARVTSRLLSGQIEVIFKEKIADKTNWRTMLKGDVTPVDLAAIRDQLFEELKEPLEQIQQQEGIQAVQYIQHGDVHVNEFPVKQYLEKITSLNFDKDPLVQGTLLGIKGQYLIFEHAVINIRKFGGYEIELSVG